MPLPLEGLLVISMDQAVAAPLCACRLADAGARVIKIERPEGDFARGYDSLAKGESAYFVWLNRGKESVVLDLTKAEDKALLERMLAKADVFIQNLKPGAIGKLGFAIERLRKDYPKLICVSISGFGESGPYATRKSYDLLVQAESGLASVTGNPEAPSRVGVSVTDVASGMNAYEAVLEAIIARGRTGQGATISVSLFDAMADWMTVPLLHHEGGKSPKRLGLSHPSISPYGVFKTKDGADILISIQNDREWRILAAGRDGRCGARRRSEVRHARRAREAPRRDRRQGRGLVRHDGCRHAVEEARSRRHRVRARERCGGVHPASAPAAHQRRYAERAGVVSGARADPRSGAQLWAHPGAGRAHREGAEGVRLSRYSIAGAASRTATWLPRSEAVEPMKNTNGIESTQIAVSSTNRSRTP